MAPGLSNRSRQSRVGGESVGLFWLLLGGMVGQKGDDGGVALLFHGTVLSSARDRAGH